MSRSRLMTPMPAGSRPQGAGALGLLLICVLVGCGLQETVAGPPAALRIASSNADKSAVTATEAAKPQHADLSAEAIKLLPLRRGYYVASETACSAASNATVLLLQRGGIGGARDFCEFKKIEQIGLHIYRVLQSCRSFEDGAMPESHVVSYTLSGDAGFTSQRADGSSYSARWCSQASMPPAWRHNDIRDAVR